MGLSPDEQQLVERISTGDTAAFKELFNTHWQFLHNVAYNRLSSVAAADDLVQDLFEDVWKNRESLEIEVSLEAYLYQAMKYKIFNFMRHRTVRQKKTNARRIRDDYYPSASSQNTDARLIANELQRAVNHEIERLPEKSRQIFTLSRRRHYTYAEIANELGCSKKTVEYHISKALGILKVNLVEFMPVVTICFLLW